MDIFEFDHYRAFLQSSLKRGMQARLAELLNCQPGFISQVLNGARELSQEHAFKTAGFLGLNKIETRYFLLLVNRDRAASKELRNHYSEMIEAIRAENDRIESRVQSTDVVSEAALARYLSHWYITAIHVLVTAEQPHDVDSLSAKLSLPKTTVADCLQFLVDQQMITRRGGTYSGGQVRIHLPRSSSLINTHHINWRLEAMSALARSHYAEDDLHYSSIMAMSRADMLRLRQSILKLIDNFEPILAASQGDELVCFTADLFSY